MFKKRRRERFRSLRLFHYPPQMYGRNSFSTNFSHLSCCLKSIFTRKYWGNLASKFLFMGKPEDFGSFISENKDLLKDYIETKTEIYRLQGIKMASKTGGLIIWAILSMFLLFLILIFSGLVLGFWFSELLGSNVFGFGLATLILILVTVLLAVFRRQLFINPIIRNIINSTQQETMEESRGYNH
jgi:hypothetical protein